MTGLEAVVRDRPKRVDSSRSPDSRDLMVSGRNRVPSVSAAWRVSSNSLYSLRVSRWRIRCHSRASVRNTRFRRLFS